MADKVDNPGNKDKIMAENVEKGKIRGSFQLVKIKTLYSLTVAIAMITNVLVIK